MCLVEKFWRANSNFSHMFVVCSTKAHGKTCVCRVFDFCHTANARVCRVPNFHRVFHLLAHVKEARMSCAWSLPCVLESDTRQKLRLFAVCLSFAVCCFGLHTANTAFAGCPRFSPWQISGHTANARFPVVIPYICEDERNLCFRDHVW